jgi:diguanylate cyclase (GGDEF)-like protein
MLDAVQDRVAALESRRDELDRALEHTARLSITDGLTGLSNRRHFELTAAIELQRARRFGEPFGVALVDLDELKAVNDRHGHQAGDAVLVELARRLTEATRDVDLVARIGGDEFVVLLPNTDAAGTRTVARKLIGRVNAPPFLVDGAEYCVTVSIGLASYPESGDTVNELLAAADAALYRAKAAGRNRMEGPE